MLLGLFSNPIGRMMNAFAAAGVFTPSLISHGDAFGTGRILYAVRCGFSRVISGKFQFQIA